MLQAGTTVKIVDNSGARFGYCIRVIGGFKKRYASIGDKVIVSIKTLRTKKRSLSKIAKGKISLALVVYTRQPVKSRAAICTTFNENGIVLITEQGKPLGSRIIGGLPKKIRSSKFMRLMSLSSGLIK